MYATALYMQTSRERPVSSALTLWVNYGTAQFKLHEHTRVQ